MFWRSTLGGLTDGTQGISLTRFRRRYLPTVHTRTNLPPSNCAVCAASHRASTTRGQGSNDDCPSFRQQAGCAVPAVGHEKLCRGMVHRSSVNARRRLTALCAALAEVLARVQKRNGHQAVQVRVLGRPDSPWGWCIYRSHVLDPVLRVCREANVHLCATIVRLSQEGAAQPA